MSVVQELIDDLREWAQVVGGCIPTRPIVDNKLSSVDSRLLDAAGLAFADAADVLKEMLDGEEQLSGQWDGLQDMLAAAHAQLDALGAPTHDDENWPDQPPLLSVAGRIAALANWDLVQDALARARAALAAELEVERSEAYVAGREAGLMECAILKGEFDENCEKLEAAEKRIAWAEEQLFAQMRESTALRLALAPFAFADVRCIAFAPLEDSPAMYSIHTVGMLNFQDFVAATKAYMGAVKHVA